MFYCEREHGNISRKVKRRTILTDAEKQFIDDATIDPCSMTKKSYNEKEREKLLEQLDITFPGIEKDEEIMGEEAAKEEDSQVSDTLARASLAMAKSLDICLSGLTDKPTLPAVQQRLRHTFSEGMKSQVTKAEAKDWCNQVAGRLSTFANSTAATTDSSMKVSLAKIQRIITESALGTGMSFEEDEEEETKLDEDEIALSQTKSESERVEDLMKLAEWVTAVASQLDACAEELTDDGLEPLYSDTLELTNQEKLGKSTSAGSLATGSKSFGISSSGYDGDVEMSTVKDSYRPKQLKPVESSVSPLPSPTKSPSSGPRRYSDPDQEMWDKILAQGASPISKRLSESGARILRATSVSTVKDALPRSTARPEKSIEPLLKRSGSRSSVKTSSLSTTLIYLFLVATVFIIGTAILFQSFQFFWTMVRERY